MDGVLVIDKPVGPTSHDIVARVRRALHEPRIGHTGTLDPNASGVLPLVLGRATRLARFLSAGDKSYDALIRLGLSTDTGDAAGAPLGSEHAGPLPAAVDIDRALDCFRGSFLQQPPAYSAKKIAGQRSYRLARAAARAGEVVDDRQPPADRSGLERPAPVMVTTHNLEIVAVEQSRLTLRVTCSAGFYVRSLARDVGERLGTGAHLVELRRVRSADYQLDQAVPLADVEHDPDAAAGALIPMAALLPRFPGVVLTSEGVRRAQHGRDLRPEDQSSVVPPAVPETVAPAREATGVETWIRLIGPGGALVGVARQHGHSGLLHPSVVLI
jgi:tRNA pseudouridine55 synthase